MNTANNYTRITMKFNGQGAQYAYGWSETYLYPLISGAANLRSEGSALAAYRTRFLCQDHSIDQVIAATKGTRGQTVKCNASPINAGYPLTSMLVSAATANLTLPGFTNMTTGGVNMSLGEIKGLSEYRVGHPQAVLTFRVEGENFKKATRQFHGIPDAFVNDASKRNLPDGWTWFGTTLTTLPGSVPATDPNYWQNVKDFFDYLIIKSVMISAHKPEVGEATPIPKYDLNKPQAMLFAGVTNKKVGRAFGEPRGRAAIAS